MTRLRSVWTIAAAGMMAASPALAQSGGPVVQTASGKVSGTTGDGVSSWKGIPFAAPPVGPLRWRAPQPVAKWSDVRPATTYSSDCMQKPFPSDAAPLGTIPAEDCLYVNVWKPTAAKGKLPVMVWIYGGGFVNGGASPPTYAGDAMAKKGVMFVSFNYRVGRFGTFALPQLSKANPDDGRLGNYGIMDQIAALKWVQQNIAAFGGDPANVTIIGESAGGISVHFLVTAPEARGLFNKAFVMSGGDGRVDPTMTLAKVEEIGANFARTKGIDPATPDALQKMRALTAEQVTDGLNMGSRPAGAPTNAGPFVDGTVVVDVAKAYAGGRFARMPMVVGATSADIGGKSGFMIAGARNVSALLADKGVPLWAYRFSYVAESNGQPGAQHASEIPFFFDNTAIKYGDKTTPRDVAMGKTISDYIVNFVKTANPNGPGLPNWPRYTRANDTIMDFTAAGTAVAGRDPWGRDIEQAEQALARAKASSHYTTLTTPLGKLMDDPAALAILQNRVPQIVSNPQIGMAKGYPLATLQAYMPAMLSNATMQQIDADLAKIPMKN